MRCDPPRTSGHPRACAVTANSVESAPVKGEVNGAIAWAANPASNARAS
jgi:hypothetical protein